jgi:nucleotide-binding universal stress UspA family protein
MGVARRIIAAVDGSTLTHSVIHTAIQEAVCRKAELHIVHVIEKEWAVPDSEEELAIREEEEEAASFLSSMKAEVEASGLEAVAHLLRGHPGDRIVDTAIDLGAELVILGSVGKSQVKRMISGSVSFFVVTYCPVTTMVVKPNTKSHTG